VQAKRAFNVTRVVDELVHILFGWDHAAIATQVRPQADQTDDVPSDHRLDLLHAWGGDNMPGKHLLDDVPYWLKVECIKAGIDVLRQKNGHMGGVQNSLDFRSGGSVPSINDRDGHT
jgi:hypothetical protein